MTKITKTILTAILAIVGLSNVANAQFTKLFEFNTSNGRYPTGSLISDGTFLYGMAPLGGINNKGVLFKVMPNGTGYVNLLDFGDIVTGTDTATGGKPGGSLFYDGTFLYGTASVGGKSYYYGTIFKIKPDGTGFLKLLDFNNTINGGVPYGSFISDGTFLYGVTSQGGTKGEGTIFKIKKDGTGYVKLYEFDNTANSNGSSPRGTLFSDGTFLYGTAGGGTNSKGTLFKIKTDGTGFTKLYDFDGTTNGGSPSSALTSDGTFLYGTTATGGGANIKGTIFKIMSDGTGYVKLLDFPGSWGSGDAGPLISIGSFLFGVTGYGGAYDYGTVFKIKTDGTGYVNLLSFGGTTPGLAPRGPLLSDGTSFYGMTLQGGTTNNGLVYKFDGAFTGIAETNREYGFAIYPNPANSELAIEIVDYKNATADIFNLKGQLLQSTTLRSEKTTLQVADLSSGIYFIKVANASGVSVQKFIKE